jgi:hypothetical protein
LFCARADVDSYRVNCGMLTRNDWTRINEATQSFKVKPSSVVISGPASVSPLDSPEAAQIRGKLIKDSLKMAADINALTFFAVEEGPQSVVPIFEKPTPNEFEKNYYTIWLKTLESTLKKLVQFSPLNRSTDMRTISSTQSR